MNFENMHSEENLLLVESRLENNVTPPPSTSQIDVQAKTPPHLKKAAEAIVSNLMPEKSKNAYLKAYENLLI